MRITSSAGATNQVRSRVKEITLDGLSQHNITVVSMDSHMTVSAYRGVRAYSGKISYGTSTSCSTISIGGLLWMLQTVWLIPWPANGWQ